jgi:mitochondrial fission protein ELM1
LLKQVAEILRRDPRVWTIATSRRTPAATIGALRALTGESVTLVRPQDEPADWLGGQLAQMPVVWVTEDSVSMLYESLTAGAACGVIGVPDVKPSRIQRGLEGLVADGAVVLFNDWRAGRALSSPAEPFDEAGRCADWMMDQWLGR